MQIYITNINQQRTVTNDMFAGDQIADLDPRVIQHLVNLTEPKHRQIKHRQMIVTLDRSFWQKIEQLLQTTVNGYQIALPNLTQLADQLSSQSQTDFKMLALNLNYVCYWLRMHQIALNPINLQILNAIDQIKTNWSKTQFIIQP